MSSRLARWLWGAVCLIGFGVLAELYRQHVVDAAVGDFAVRFGEDHFELLRPKALALLLAIPALLFVMSQSLADLPWQQRVVSLTLRMAFVACLATAVGGLSRTETSARVATVFLLDVSNSVADDGLEAARGIVVAAQQARPNEDLLRVVVFAGSARLLDLPVGEEEWTLPTAKEMRTALSKEPKLLAASDIQSAMQLGYAVFPPGYLKRMVLISDGLETQGDLLAEAGRASIFGVKLSTHVIDQAPPPEVAVRSLTVPDKVEVGQPFELVGEVYASRATSVRGRLYQGEMLNGLDGVRKIELKAGTNELRFKSVVRFGGKVTYRLVIDQVKGDRFVANNHQTATLEVPGRPTVLYIEGQPQRANYLSGALSAQQFEVDVRSPSGFPGSLKELERYDLVVLSDTPKEKVSAGSQDLIERYVRDLGGGFVFAGGEAGFGLGGWAHSTLERILPVRMDAERRKEMPSVAMALVIDRSGSMTGLPMEMAKAACRATVGVLRGDDLLEIIAFDSRPKRYVKMQPARYRSRIQNEIASIQAGGGTEFFGPLDMAYQDISVVQARKKHVILLTDGNADSNGLRDLIQAMLAESITVTTVGLGNGSNADLLRMIADTGGGRYHHVPDPNSLPRIFTHETEMISRQAAVQEWFPVVQVGAADFLKGIAISHAPLLHGYVATQLKPAPAQLILASDQGEPILARWRVGLGWTLAWTSDVKNLWASDWLRWQHFGRFWGQLVREHMRRKHRREIPMKVSRDGDRVRAVVDAFTAGQRFDNQFTSRLLVSGPEPKGRQREVMMRQVAPGRYEANFLLEEYGSFSLRAEHSRENDEGEQRRVGVSYGHISHPYPAEYARFAPDKETLQRAAVAGLGHVDPTPAQLFDPGDDILERQEPLWQSSILLAMLIFLLDLWVRRVRLFDRRFASGVS
ncbi:MAG: VWA domain-containing protein [Polyangiaceae bacterium]|nr:VWA domain-containing protein [Polyangiaceae bacterium]